MTAMKALVTGAHGFVGHHLVEHLTAMGDDVTGIDRATDGLDITQMRSVAKAAAAKGRVGMILVEMGLVPPETLQSGSPLCRSSEWE